MSTLRKLVWTVCAVALTCLLAGGSVDGAGKKKTNKETDKKVEEKKDDMPVYNGANFKKSGALKADDPKDTKIKEAPSQTFAVALTEGKTYRIDLVSKDFDAFVRLEYVDEKTKKSAEVAFDDDSGGFPNARIVYRAPKGGKYLVIVTSFDRKPGKYDLSTVELSATETPKAVASEFASQAIALTLKDGKVTYTGDLTLKDAMAKKHHYKVFTVQMEKDIEYRIDLKNAGPSANFDPLLFLEDANRVRITSDDDGGGDFNARIVFTPQQSGTYRIVATTTPIAQTGRFTLDVVRDMPAKKDKTDKDN